MYQIIIAITALILGYFIGSVLTKYRHQKKSAGRLVAVIDEEEGQPYLFLELSTDAKDILEQDAVLLEVVAPHK